MSRNALFAVSLSQLQVDPQDESKLPTAIERLSATGSHLLLPSTASRRPRRRRFVGGALLAVHDAYLDILQAQALQLSNARRVRGRARAHRVREGVARLLVAAHFYIMPNTIINKTKEDTVRISSTHVGTTDYATTKTL